MNKEIPQFQPQFDESDAQAVYQYLKSGGWAAEFRKTADLERLIADFTGARHCIMVTSGTAALTLSLAAHGVGAGDEVIVPNLTMAATANAAIFLGAKVVFADVEADSLTLGAESVAEKITASTKAVVHVSLNGRAGSLQKLTRLCAERGLPLIEDAAQSLGSFADGRHLGTLGNIGILSFSTPKIITTGQGGALLTNDGGMAEKLRRLKNFGRLNGGEDIYDQIGFNYKFTDLQAVLGLAQWKKLPDRIERKKRLYWNYQEALRDLPGLRFLPMDLQSATPWFVDIYVPHRVQLVDFLRNRNIATRNIYPALHTQAAYRSLPQVGSFPISGNAANEGLWLPSDPYLEPEQIFRVTSAIRTFWEEFHP